MAQTDKAAASSLNAPQGCSCGDAARVESYPATKPTGERVIVTRCQRCGAHEVTTNGKD